MAASTHLVELASVRIRLHRQRGGRFSHGIGQGLEVVAGGEHRLGVAGEAKDLPATRGGEATAVLVAQVVAVRFGVGRQRTEDCC